MGIWTTMNFITKTEFKADYQLMYKDMTDLINNVGWPEDRTIDGKFYSGNQLGVKYRPGAQYPMLDCIGSLYDKATKTFTGYEHEFTEYVDELPEYTKNVIKQLETDANIKFGRIRYMRLLTKRGLSVHLDLEKRYHYVFDTNPNAFFGEKTEGELAAKCYHIPNDGHFYLVDTTREHFVYNGGWEPRIHLVLDVAE